MSRNGTGSLMRNGDRLSLVLSVTPLVEHFFIYHAGMAGSLFLEQAFFREAMACARLCERARQRACH